MPDYIVAAFGKDRPGVLAKISTEIAGLGGNIDVCRTLNLRGYHGLVFEVSMEAPREALEEALSPLADDYLAVVPAVAETNADPPKDQYDISIVGEDRVGLVAEVSTLLAAHGLNIASVNSDSIGENAYVMQLRGDTTDESTWVTVEAELGEKLRGADAVISTISPVAVGLIAAIVRIGDVRLCASGFHVEGEVADADIASYRTGYFAQLKDLDDNGLVVNVGFRLVQNPPDGSGRQALNASATFELRYLMRRPVRGIQCDLQAFADSVAVSMALPYWRELVQSMLPSMGVHKLVVPAFPLPGHAIAGRVAPQ